MLSAIADFLSSIKSAGGSIIRVDRGIQPHWYDIAVQANKGVESAIKWLKEEKIHASETAWVGTRFDYILDNNSTLDSLFNQVETVVQPDTVKI